MRLGIIATFLGFTLAAPSSVLSESRPSSPGKPRTLIEHWQSSRLSYDVLKNFIEPANCHSSERRFIGCLESVDLLLGVNAMSLTATLEDVGQGYSIAFTEQPRLETPARIEKLKRVFERVRNLSAEVSFDAIRTLAIAEAKKKDQNGALEPIVTGQALNQYLSWEFDLHTKIEPRSVFSKDSEVINPMIAGVGIRFKEITLIGPTAQKRFVIQSVVPGSPAEAAGIRAGDILLEFDGKDASPASSTSSNPLQLQVQGAPGTQLRIKLRRGTEIHERVITRAVLKIPHVYSSLERRIGVIRVEHFRADDTCATFKSALASLKAQGARGIVLDLRGNSGGLMVEATCISAALLPKGAEHLSLRPLPNPVSARLIQPSIELNAQSGDTQTPLTILMDSKSASASEIVAGTLQDHGRAHIVGDRSFGKGVFQVVFETEGLPEDRAHYFGIPPSLLPYSLVFNQTHGWYVLPNGCSPQKRGIRPDFPLNFAAESPAGPSGGFREETAINAVEGYCESDASPVVDPRLKSCVSRLSRSVEEARKSVQGEIPPDHALETAFHVLECQTQGVKPLARASRAMLIPATNKEEEQPVTAGR